VSTASILNDIGVPWPDADSGKARQAATAWRAISSAAQDALNTAGSAANALSEHNSGAAMDAFNTFWGTVGGPFEACTVADKPALLPVLIEACDALAASCDNFADAVDEAKRKLEETAAEIVSALAAGALATVFTLGISDAVSDSVSTYLVGTAVGSIELLGTTIADIVGKMAAGVVFAEVDTILEADFGDSAKTLLGEKLPTAQEDLDDLFKALFVGGLTGGLGHFATNAAKTAALNALVGLPDSASTLVPQLPGILAQIPGALETPAGEVLKTLASEYAANGMVNGVNGKSTDAPTLPEILGELLNSKIEAAGAQEGKGGE
jgi:hypothetical protein